MVRFVRNLFTGLTLAAALSCSVFASAQTIYFSGGSLNIGSTTGIFGTITPNGAAATVNVINNATTAQLSGLAFSSTGVLYGVSDDATTLYTVNPNTGALTTIGATGLTGIADGLAFNSSGTLFLANQTSNLYTVNPATGLATLVGPIGNASSATIGFDGSGNLFQTNNDPANGAGGVDILESVNTTTGAGTPIGTDTAFTDIFGLAFSSGSLFGFTAGGDVITLNTATGLGTPFGSYTLPNNAAGQPQIIFAATAGTPGAVPEPSTLALLAGMSVTGTSVFLRRKRSKMSA